MLPYSNLATIGQPSPDASPDPLMSYDEYLARMRAARTPEEQQMIHALWARQQQSPNGQQPAGPSSWSDLANSYTQGPLPQYAPAAQGSIFQGSSLPVTRGTGRVPRM